MHPYFNNPPFGSDPKWLKYHSDCLTAWETAKYNVGAGLQILNSGKALANLFLSSAISQVGPSAVEQQIAREKAIANANLLVTSYESAITLYTGPSGVIANWTTPSLFG